MEKPTKVGSAHETNFAMAELIAGLIERVEINGVVVVWIGVIEEKNDIFTMTYGDEHGGVYRLEVDIQRDTACVYTVKPPSVDFSI